MKLKIGDKVRLKKTKYLGQNPRDEYAVYALGERDGKPMAYLMSENRSLRWSENVSNLVKIGKCDHNMMEEIRMMY